LSKRKMVTLLRLTIIATLYYPVLSWQFQLSRYVSVAPLATASSLRNGVFSITRKPVFSMTQGHVEATESGVKPCLYKTSDGWRQRVELDRLEVGQKIFGYRIPGADLLDGKTGPKLFFECGIGRINAKGEWQMVSAMLRFQTKYKKVSVIRKKTKKLSGKRIELFVHKIRLDHGQLEVCVDEESLQHAIANDKRKSIIPASSLQIGQELNGTVTELRPYGCFVDVGANRQGLLHIQCVANLFGKYIDKETGLKKYGLGKGAVIRVAVASNKNKRLALDFTQDVKEDAKKPQETEIPSEEVAKIETEETKESPPDDEEYGWGAYSADDFYGDDEDRDIEDALGLGSY